jgi:putrescine transport system substrate-binding protein
MSAHLRTIAALAMLGALLTACGKPAEEAKVDPAAPVIDTDAEKVLNVYNWSDYIKPNAVDEKGNVTEVGLIEQFEKETGIKVNYEVMDDNAMLETKLRAGRTGYDIVVPSASYLANQIKSNIYQKLDRTKLKNWGNLDPAILKALDAFDPGNQYAVNYMWGTSGVAYNEEKIKEIDPNAPVNSLAIFYDPKEIRKFQKCGVSVLDAAGEVVGTVLIYLGKDANSENLDDLKAAEKVLMAIRPYIRTIHSSDYIDALANGERCLVLGWSGDVLQAAARAEENKKPFHIKYHIPKEGAVQFFDNLAIPADAAHVKNAHLFIDFLNRPEIAAKNSDYISYANGNSASLPLISDEVKGNPDVYPPPELMAKLVPDLPESAEFTKELTRMWQHFKTGK